MVFFFNSASLLKKNSFSFSSSENIFISTSIFEGFLLYTDFWIDIFFNILTCHYTDFWPPSFQMIMSTIFQIIVPLYTLCFLKKKNNTSTFNYDVLKCNFPCIYSFEVHWGYSIYEPIYSLKYGEFSITTCLIHFFLPYYYPLSLRKTLDTYLQNYAMTSWISELLFIFLPSFYFLHVKSVNFL